MILTGSAFQEYSTGEVSRLNNFFASGFNSPDYTAFDIIGNLFVANDNNGTISKITPSGVVSTFVS